MRPAAPLSSFTQTSQVAGILYSQEERIRTMAGYLTLPAPLIPAEKAFPADQKSTV